MQEIKNQLKNINPGNNESSGNKQMELRINTIEQKIDYLNQKNNEF